MKKIGIVTFWDSKDNYGQLLQCYALTFFLKSLHYQPKLIKVAIFEKNTLLHKIKTLFNLLKTPYDLFEVLQKKRLGNKSRIINIAHPRNFDNFRSKYIPSTDIIQKKDLFSRPPYFDAYVTGSDQVWNSLSPLYFLQFAPKESKKIAYAASMGGFKPDASERLVLKDYVKDFDYVSLREKEALAFFKQSEICEADYVPDPTLLLLKEDYQKLYKERKLERPYILLYLLGNKLQFNIAEIYQYAEKRGLDVIYIASQGRCDNYKKEYPSIEEWLYLIENSEIVVTNSFHGTVFSMIYRKKFVTLLLNGLFSKMNDRITDMLNKYGLENRIYSGIFEKYDCDVDYSFFEKIVKEEREYVRNKLINVIG